MKIEKSAIKFYKEIEKESNKYKLVNGLFIVKYINKEECVYIGEFAKSKTALNDKKTNLVFINDSPSYIQRFNKKLKMVTTSLGVWTKLNIKFIEKPIKEILN